MHTSSAFDFSSEKKKGVWFPVSAASLSLAPNTSQLQSSLKNNILSEMVISTPELKPASHGTFFFFSVCLFCFLNSKTMTQKDTNLVRWIFHHPVNFSTLNTNWCFSRTTRQAATYRTSPGRNHMYFLKLNRNKTLTIFFRFVPLIARQSAIFCSVLSTRCPCHPPSCCSNGTWRPLCCSSMHLCDSLLKIKMY